MHSLTASSPSAARDAARQAHPAWRSCVAALRRALGLGPRLESAAQRPVDVASLAAFRCLFGLVMCGALLRSLAKGWVQALYAAPPFHFTYGPFWFVRPWPGVGMTLHVTLTALSALGVAFGLCFRLSACCFFFGFTYLELIDQASYLNHYYLVSLLAGLLLLSPAGRAFSIDARRRPERAIERIPAGFLFVFRYQLGLVYAFAGVAKLNRDWLLDGQPLRLWLAARVDLPLVGPFLDQPGVALAASWFGAAFDLCIVPLLCWPRTRQPAFALLVLFHVATGILFPIGIFPWLMIASASLFFAPDWPRRLRALGCLRVLGRLRALGRLEPGRHAYDARTPLGSSSSPSSVIKPRVSRVPRWLTATLIAHSAVQTLLPLRAAGRTLDCAWTARCFNFAWNVMIVEKAGQVRLRGRERESGRAVELDAERLLAPFQRAAMAQDPALVRALALELAHRFREQTGRDVAIYADAFATINGRPARRLLDPNVDLTRPLPTSWITPFEAR